MEGLEKFITEKEVLIICSEENYEKFFMDKIWQNNNRGCDGKCTLEDLNDNLDCKCVVKYDLEHPFKLVEKVFRNNKYLIKLEVI